MGLDPVRRAIYMLVLIQLVEFGGGIAGQSVTVVRTLILLEGFVWACRRLGLIRIAEIVPAATISEPIGAEID